MSKQEDKQLAEADSVMVRIEKEVDHMHAQVGLLEKGTLLSDHLDANLAEEVKIKGLASSVEALDQSSYILPQSPRFQRAIASLPSRHRTIFLAVLVGLSCGIVASVYEMIMDFALELVWKQLGPMTMASLPWAPTYVWIPAVCIFFGGLTGVLLRLLGEPQANLPGTVQAFHRDGKLDIVEAPAMGAISICSIIAAGSLGPEAPLVSIGGAVASSIAELLRATKDETLMLTLAGMGAGLAAFFGEPVGGSIFALEVIHRMGLEYHEAILPTVVAGLSCNLAFRVLSSLPQKAIWTFPAEPDLMPAWTVLGVPLGVLGGLLGLGWIKLTITIREKLLAPYGLGPRHVVKGLMGGAIIGTIGVLLPPTLFWAEHEAQSIIDGGATPLPHVWPAEGALGALDLTSAPTLLAIGFAKLLAISITVLAGYRGGFIFPFMFAGHSIGCAIAIAVPGVPTAAAALSCAAAINTAVTRTVLATPIVLTTLSGRSDCFPIVLIASIVSLFCTGDAAIIKAAQPRRARPLGEAGR